MIDLALSKDDCFMSVRQLCKWARVSKTAYYNYSKNIRNPNRKEIRDRFDFNLILEVYSHKGFKKGSRTIQMMLARKGIYMSRNKIRRLMHKYGLFCPIRKPNPYKQMQKNIEANSVVDNIVNRDFKGNGPRFTLLTDITYLFYGKCNKCYLSVVKDAYSNEILGYCLSESMEEDFVLDTIKMVYEKHGTELKYNCTIHSDQGVHYKATAFKEILHNYNLRQSMSRKANCWDNAPQESFFGHMKDEIDINSCSSFEDVKTLIENYIYYYNNERPQQKLAKLTPKEYYNYYITGQYPLELKEF